MEDNREQKDKNAQGALNKLISDEWFAGNIYKQFMLLASDEAAKQTADLMAETSNDELNDHFRSLVQFAKANGYDVPSTYSEMKKHADKQDIKLFESCKKDQDALFYLNESVKSEQRAIDTYEKYVNGDALSAEPQLQVIVKSNYYDELEHLESFKFAIESIESFNMYN